MMLSRRYGLLRAAVALFIRQNRGRKMKDAVRQIPQRLDKYSQKACPKCEFPVIKMSYCDKVKTLDEKHLSNGKPLVMRGTELCPDEKYEHFHFTCARCNYRWLEKIEAK